MEKTTIYLPDELRQGLRAAAQRTGRPQAELIREAIRRLIDETPANLGGFIGVAAAEDFSAADDEATLAAEWRAGRRRPARR